MARRGENIHKRKDGRWEGRYIKARTPEGKIQWGYVYGTVYAEVKRVLVQKKAEAGFYNLKRTDLTFEALAEVWLHSQRNAVKESTYAHYSYTMHKYLLPVLSKVPVASLDESFLEQAMQQIIAPIDAAHKPLGNSSARECLSMLRRICKYAAHLRLIRPMELEVALPKAIDKTPVPLSPVEQPVLPEVVEEDVVTITDETTGALTPEGNLTMVDDYHTNYSDGSGQQFITLVSKSGATFYLVIDRNSKGAQTVHFMNLVDEADLLV